jgi:hypothetical protein
VHLRVEVVESDDVASLVDEPSRESAADEAGSAGEQYGALSLCGECQESNHPWSMGAATGLVRARITGPT